MKFCVECGAPFGVDEKFCGECGKQRNQTPLATSPSHKEPDLDWQKFVAKYKPKKNQFTELNEAFDGFFFVSWGSVGDWVSFESRLSVWSVLAQDGDLGTLKCQSGRWSGPDVVGFFVCEKEVPDDQDFEFFLNKEYSSFNGLLVVLDQFSGKWRPCRYLLRNDLTPQINVDALPSPGGEDDSHRDLAEQSKFARAQAQVMCRVTIEDGDVRDSWAESLDGRYFLICSAPVMGWTDSYVDEYESINSSFLIGSIVDDFERLLMFNTPTDSYFEQVARCLLCEQEFDGDDSLEDHVCQDGDLGDETFASFAQTGNLQYLSVQIALDGLVTDERKFRDETLTQLHLDYTEGNLVGFDFLEREEDEMALAPFQLACFSESLNMDKLTKPCNSCYRFNLENAQICYSCCNTFVSRISGDVYVSIINDVTSDQVDEMEPEDFASWANVYYFVAPKGAQMSYVRVV